MNEEHIRIIAAEIKAAASRHGLDPHVVHDKERVHRTIGRAARAEAVVNCLAQGIDRHTIATAFRIDPSTVYDLKRDGLKALNLSA